VVVVRLVSSRYTSAGEQVRTRYTADQVDAVAVYCDELDRCYLLRATLFDGMRGLHLRVGATRNGQRASLNWARDFEFPGAVAQLGERRYGIPEAVGSSPTSSTSPRRPRQSHRSCGIAAPACHLSFICPAQTGMHAKCAS
jgi:hypothetical protein